MSADGNASPAPTGGSLLTTGLPEAPPPPAPNSAAEAVQAVVDGPPEWAPVKYWDPATKSLKTEDLAKGYTNLEKLLGREKVPVPVSDDDAEGWERWYAATGRPEDPDKYEFKRPENLNGIEYDEDLEKHYRQAAHVSGLNKKQANALYDGFVKHQFERAAAYQTHQTQAKSQVQADLMREYGAQYEGALANAKAALARYADPDYLRYLDESGRGNDPREIRAWIKVGRELGGTTKLKGAAASEAAPADLERAIADFTKKHNEELFNKDHPDHSARVAERSKLYEMRYAQLVGQ